MSASADRRKRSTFAAAVVAVVGVVLTVAITVVGAATLADSRAGRDVTGGSGTPERELPDTPTAMIGVLGEDGSLTSIAIAVLTPDGIGGSLVIVPATADSSFQRTGDVFPLAETLAVAGPEALLVEVEALSSITFDIAELVDRERLEVILSRAPILDVEIPADLDPWLADALHAEHGIEPGSVVTMTASMAAALLADPIEDQSPSVEHELLRVAIWQAFAAGVGAGTGEIEEEPAEPADLDAFLDRLVAGSIGDRVLPGRPVDVELNPREVDAVSVDRAEVLLVFGQIAPRRVASPNPSLTFRIESRFSEEQLRPFGINSADVARDAIEVLLFLQANVISVETSAQGAPPQSDARVADPEMAAEVEESWELVFGAVDVAADPTPIAGVDATVILGESYLEQRFSREGGVEDR